METHLLEINLISAQGLKPPSANLRRMQTYAVAWIDSAFKLRTRIDRIGGENPTWNDKFIFRVATDFLSYDTSAVCIEIYAVGYITDALVGTVRLLIGNCLSSITSSSASGPGFGIPSFAALQIRRPSGRFHGVLNIGAMMINGSDLSTLTGVSAIGYRYLMGENRRKRRGNPATGDDRSGLNSCENHSCTGDSAEYSSDADSSCSSTNSVVLKDLNGKREMAGNKERSSSSSSSSNGAGLLCGLGFQKKIHLSPSDLNLHNIFAPSDEKGKVDDER